MGLSEYKKKRNFDQTSEPKGKIRKEDKKLHFVIQKHAASRLHYDFRLELDGVLKSWAIPKGPSLDPSVKRLAMMVEDHPYDYKDFEGIIPKGNYGAGKVIIWDQGNYHALQSTDSKESYKYLTEGLKKGDLKFVMNGEKIKGAFALVRIKKDDQRTWLLIKKMDEFATDEEITTKDDSVISGKKVEEISDEDEKWIGESEERKSKKKKQRSKEPKTELKLNDIPKARMPHDIKPMLATLVNKPFDNPAWIFEIKFDGYRVIAEIKSGKVNLYSRNNKSFNKKFGSIVDELTGYKYDTIFDGEAVILDKAGRPDFQLLQNYQTTGKGDLVYYIFDILYFDGHDLTGQTLLKRKELLTQVIPSSEIIRYSDHIIGDGIDFYKAAKKQKLEGIIAKDGKSLYKINTRTKAWLKIKTQLRQEAIICGYTKPKGGRKHFGSLVLGVYKNDELIYIGQSGGGFNEKLLGELKKQMKDLIIDESPFKEKVKANTPITWVKPKLICEVSFSEWTEEGSMRHPIFVGLREDKKIKEIVKEIPRETSSIQNKIKSSSKTSSSEGKEMKINNHTIKLTNLDKIFWEEEGYTKGDLIDYYRSISKYILPYLKDRPESLLRHPHGIKGEGFFQKNITQTVPDWVKTEKIFSEHNSDYINYLICNNEATLIYMANLGCIEINPWFSRLKKLDNPDYFVIDLDPEEISFDKVVETALVVKDVLDEAGAVNYCKTSGASGLHIYVPLNGKYDYDVAKDFAHVIARLVHKRIPQFTSVERSPSKRKKKVYLDYLQNRKGQTLAAPYSVRPKPGATVATPLLWEEVKIGLSPKQFTIKNIHERLQDTGDLFKAVLGKGININHCIRRLESEIQNEE